MLRKIILFFVLSVIFSACKKADIDSPMSVTFKKLSKANQIGVQDTAYVDIAGGKANETIVKFISSDDYSLSIDQEGNNYVLFTQHNSDNATYIIAGLVSKGQVKAKDTLYIKGTGDVALSNAFICLNYKYVYKVDLSTYQLTYLFNTGAGSPHDLSKSPDGQYFMVNDYSTYGFRILNASGILVSTNAAYGVANSYSSRFTYDGKYIYGSVINSFSGGYYVRDFTTKSTKTLPVPAANSTVTDVFIGSTSPVFDHIAYVEKSGSYRYLKYYKGGIISTIASISADLGAFGDIAVSRDGKYIAYDIISNNINYPYSRYLKVYNISNGATTTVDYTTDGTTDPTDISFNSRNQIAYTMSSSIYRFSRYTTELLTYDMANNVHLNLSSKPSIYSDTFSPNW